MVLRKETSFSVLFALSVYYSLVLSGQPPSEPKTLLVQALHFAYVSGTINGLCDFISIDVGSHGVTMATVS